MEEKIYNRNLGVFRVLLELEEELISAFDDLEPVFIEFLLAFSHKHICKLATLAETRANQG